MGKLLAEASPETTSLVASILAEEYPAIASLSPGLRIGVLMATSDIPGKPALAKGGYPAAGMIRVVSEEDRAAGGPDVIVLLDGDKWPGWDDTVRYSLIHHELHHLMPVKLRQQAEGGFTCDLDGLDRPKIRLRKHDFEIGGFDVIVERHGDAAIEWQSVKRVHERFAQQTLPFVTRKQA
jgi:hypothetical protein